MVCAVGLIPARYESSRFPGKPLAPIAGISLIQRTFENASQSGLERVIVATDDQRIYDHVVAFGGDAIMTSSECQTGTDRLAEAVAADEELQRADVIVNIQGDWPCISPESIDAVAGVLEHNDVMGSAVVALRHAEQLFDPSMVKCVMGQTGEALYFSRSPIPYPRSLQSEGPLPAGYWGHLGIYSYRPDFLLHYRELPMTPLQQVESLEQLKVLEHGYSIRLCVVDEVGPSVDHPEDIEKVEQYLCQNTSL
jgi:3-deoxy-manno-octulosonate cytidylyltransferase (CMP-KDO synthetase)